MVPMDMHADSDSLRYEPVADAAGFDRPDRPTTASLPVIEL